MANRQGILSAVWSLKDLIRKCSQTDWIVWLMKAWFYLTQRGYWTTGGKERSADASHSPSDDPSE